MSQLTDHPWMLFIATLIVTVAAALAGTRWSKSHHGLPDGARETFGIVQAATLTLLALLIGFAFSMAAGRYDQRKNYEEAEANAIGTELARVDLLDPAVQPAIRGLLGKFLAVRIRYYTAESDSEIPAVHAEQSRLESALWSAIVAASATRRDQVTALAVSGMNDVLNAEGYTQAAWWYRIPATAWLLMVVLAACANLLVGVGVRNFRAVPSLLLVMPLFISISFAFIADIDSPRGGLIRVVPQNLVALADSLHASGH